MIPSVTGYLEIHSFTNQDMFVSNQTMLNTAEYSGNNLTERMQFVLNFYRVYKVLLVTLK